MMPTYRFRVEDPMNPWARSVEVEGIDEIEAEARAESWLFARRTVGDDPRLVHLELVDR